MQINNFGKKNYPFSRNIVRNLTAKAAPAIRQEIFTTSAIDL
jgi:hypothetical protein